MIDKNKELDDFRQYPTKFIKTGQSAEKPIEGGKVGEVYFERDTKKLKIWNGNAWVSFTGT